MAGTLVAAPQLVWNVTRNQLGSQRSNERCGRALLVNVPKSYRTGVEVGLSGTLRHS